MEMNRIFLETNSYSRFARGDNHIKKQIENADEIFVSVIKSYLLFLGFREGKREHENLRLLKAFLSEWKVKVVNVNKSTSWEYGKIKYDLRKAGKPIPENDIWIAAQVAETDSLLVTYDKHFLDIKGLKVWKKLIGKRSKF